MENVKVIEKWKPTHLLDKIPTDGEDKLLVAMNLDWICSKLINEHEDLDEQLLQFALPMVIRLYHKDPEIIKNTPFPIMWIRMKNVFNELELPEPVGYSASEMSKINMETFFKKLYKRLKQ